MYYIEKIYYDDSNITQEINKDWLNGGWVAKGYTLGSNVSYNANTYYKFDISSYLPNDGHDYEIIITSYASTGGAINNEIHNYVCSGENRWLTCRISSFRTGVKASRSTCSVAIIPVRHNDKYVGLYHTGNTASGGNYFRIAAYKRIGNNNWDGSKSNVKLIKTSDNQILTLGSDYAQGKWVKYDKEVMNNITINSSSDNTGPTYILDLSSHIPNDGFDYEVFLSCQINTNETNGAHGNLRFYIYNQQEIWACSEINDAANNKTRWCNVRIPIKANDRRVYMRNIYAGSPIYVWTHIHAYRRLSTYV